MQKRQKIVPNPAISSVSVARRTTVAAEQLSERARIRAATIAQQNSEAMRAPVSPVAPAPLLRDELTQQRRREIGAPMATMIDPLDPLDGLGNSVLDIWSRISTPLMFAVWSIGCFALGRLS